MSVFYNPRAIPGNEQVVRRPRPADAIGAALRDVFGGPAALPAEMVAVLERLGR